MNVPIFIRCMNTQGHITRVNMATVITVAQEANRTTLIHTNGQKTYVTTDEEKIHKRTLFAVRRMSAQIHMGQ